MYCKFLDFSSSTKARPANYLVYFTLITVRNANSLGKVHSHQAVNFGSERLTFFGASIVVLRAFSPAKIAFFSCITL